MFQTHIDQDNGFSNLPVRLDLDDEIRIELNEEQHHYQLLLELVDYVLYKQKEESKNSQ